MNIYQKYYDNGYRGQFWPQAPRLKHPSTMNQQGVVSGCMGWTKREFEIGWANDIHQDCGVCLRTDYFPTIDIDLSSQSLVQRVLGLAIEMLGEPMVRTRTNSNRIALIYRSVKHDKYPPVRFRRKYIRVGDSYKASVNEMVEILSYNKQVVVEGIHTSGKPYELDFRPAKELTHVNPDKFWTFRKVVEELIPADYVVEKHPTHERTSTEGDVTNSGSVVDLYEDFEIELEDDTLTLVGDIVKEKNLHGRYCCDPYERSYGDGNRRIAVIYLDKGLPIIRSFAHGGITYFLHDHRNGNNLIQKGVR